MESEERPAKMRKLEHNMEASDTPDEENPPANGEAGTEDFPAPDQQLLAGNLIEEDHAEENGTAEGEKAAPKLSKNQLKKQARLERWEAGREDRKIKRREKIKEKKERRREEWRQQQTNEDGDGADGTRSKRPPPFRQIPHGGTQVPITVIFDCDFEELMFDNELKSLGLQITRCYSDNRKAKYQAHLAISSFGGKMKERFDGILAKQYTSWKGVRFFSEDFVEVATKSKEWMTGPEGGTLEGAIAEGTDTAADDGEGEVVYLSSESDVVLDRLKPNGTYIIGGLVDKNRHKGICYKRAMNRGIKTAKLPIGEFLHMKSRQVLVTNHVLEIMLRWMETGDWGKAFMAVLPERKGAKLKSEVEEDVDDGIEAPETKPLEATIETEGTPVTMEVGKEQNGE
jgi:tRNA (guanine9-N1)-methyltransferase